MKRHIYFVLFSAFGLSTFAETRNHAAESDKPDMFVKDFFVLFYRDNQINPSWRDVTYAVKYFTPSLAETITSKKATETLDFDPIIQAQDFEIRELKTEIISQDASNAVVRTSFRNFGNSMIADFILRRLPGGWRIRDVCASGQTEESSCLSDLF
jgi:Protein of unknown function (DUF3828)